MAIDIAIPAFPDGGAIPAKHTCSGDNLSPLIRWEGEPKHTVTFVLVMEDVDAADGPFTHWLIYNIPGDCHELEEIIPIEHHLENGAIQGKNDSGKYGYFGPCPPKGKEHKYVITIYALKKKLKPESANKKEDLMNIMKDYVIDKGEYAGYYHRKKG